MAVVEAEPQAEASAVQWQGVLAIEGHPTSDMRYLMPGDISERDLPLTLMAQTVNDEGHKGAEVAGRITEIWREPRKDLGDDAVAIMGGGDFVDSEFGMNIADMVESETLRGISLDLPADEVLMLDPETKEPIPEEDMTLEAMLGGQYLQGIKGKIAGATIVAIPAFEEASISIVTASGSLSVISSFGIQVVHDGALTAAAAPVKPPREWFQDPGLSELTPLRISKEGRIFGHLADWDGCHTGFGDVCVPPFRSFSDYAYFNVGEIETAEGELVPCGKLMFCREGNGHAPLDPRMSAMEVSKYYDDATKVGGFVRAGADRHGTWLAGALRPGLTQSEIQHLRTHPPSGDWRPIPGKGSELVAAFSVPIPGFPIPRSLVASGNEGQLMVITGPLVVQEMGPREFSRRKAMLTARLKAVLAASE